MSQCENILKHLQSASIIPSQALTLYGCTRLAARIFELKKAGHDIKPKLIEVRGRHGKAYVSRYTL